MENDIWYDVFMEALYKKFPQKVQLAQALMKLLDVEREAVYRRLRKEVIFPGHEIVKIASAWNISLNEIIGVNSGQIPFLMQPINFQDSSEKEMDDLQQLVQHHCHLRNSSDSEYMEICNRLPHSLTSGFEYLNRFNLFKWMNQYGKEKKVVPFSQIIVLEKAPQLTFDYYQAIKNVSNTNYVWDLQLFHYFIGDIRYYCSIQLITDEEKKLIKEDLYAFLDYMLEVANVASFPETKNKVNLYISQLNIDTNYSYISMEQLNICYIHVFGKFEVCTVDSKMVKNFKTWMQAKKRSSIQISEVGERSRVEFFTKQRELIDKL